MNIVLIGSDGAMGKVVISLAKELDYHVVAGLQATASDDSAFPIATDFKELAEITTSLTSKPDVIIDFSTPHLTNGLVSFALEQSLPIMLATTGQSAEQEATIKKAGEQIAILDTHNTSIGVNVMQQITEQMSKILYPLGYDIEIIEKHHRYKKDAPSGTAKMLLSSAEAGVSEETKHVYGREGVGEARERHEIGVHAIRGGDIVGEHTVIFANNQETLELTHRAGSKELFARGAIAGAKFLKDVSQPGIYSMNDIF